MNIQEKIDNLKQVFEMNKLPVAIVSRKNNVEIQVPGDLMVARKLIEDIGIYKDDYKVNNSVITIDNEILIFKINFNKK